ncbi:MAG: hypothetical protein HY719_07190, partial [Planctomycetes bacterium]|nr:hypothetical protein [Planctomycetota bacterium]
MNVREALDQPRTTLEAAPEAVVSPRKRAVLILGVHRSGTSAVTRVVNLLGAALPTRLMPAAADNEAGFWESADLMEIHEAALASAGATWQEVSAVPRTWFESDAAREFRDRLVAVLRHDFQQCGMFVIKDPRMCLLAPLWRQALAAFDAEPCYVIPVRNPLEVAASLKKRDALPFARSLLLWVTNFIEAETETRGAARAIVRYEQLLNDWRPVARAMERDLRLVWPRRSLAAEAEIDAFLSNRLRHHEYRLDDLLIRPELGGWVKRLYVAALNAQANGQPLSTAVDAVSAEVREAHLAFGPLLAEAERDLRATREHAAHLTRTLAAHENTAATRAADDDARRREEAARERAAAAEQERDRALAERDAALSTRAAALAARDAAAQEREAALYSRDQERERARTETERLTAALAASEASLAASASEVARLALALREAEAAATAWDKESAARLEALDAERARLDAALAAKAHEAADMAGRLATARADLHKTRTRTQTFLTHAETLREKVARAEQATRERDQALAAAAARERALELTLDGERRAHEADAAQSRTEIDEQQNRAAGLRADIESLARELRSPLLRAARRLRDGWFRLKGWVAGRYPAPAVATLGLEPWPLRGPGWRRETTEGGPGAEVRLEGAFDAGWTVIGFTAQADGPCAVEIAVDEAGSEARWEGGALGAKMAWRQYAIRLGAATQAIAIRFVGHPGALLFTNEVVRRDGWWTRRLLARSDEGRALVARGSLSAWAAAALLPGASRACLLAFAPRELVAGETVAPPDVGSAPVRASSVGPPDVG